MENILYKSALKNKKNELINTLNLLADNISKKIIEKNNIIKALNKQIEENNPNIFKEKNEELELLKSELENILNDIDTIIMNITK
jgi:hypothetical protein